MILLTDNIHEVKHHDNPIISASKLVISTELTITKDVYDKYAFMCVHDESTSGCYITYGDQNHKFTINKDMLCKILANDWTILVNIPVVDNTDRIDEILKDMWSHIENINLINNS